MSKDFLSLFKRRKPIFAMLHLKGDDEKDVFDRAKKEINIFIEEGVDAIIVENYFGNYYHMEMVLNYLKESKFDIVYGVNCLNLDVMGFDLAKRFNASFVQLDSVAGHCKQRDDYTFEAFMKKNRAEYDGFVIGGVRFKYQPYLSKRTLKEDLEIAMTRCDAIVVTQDATGEETSMSKILEFKEIIKDFPLIVGAGLTPQNCEKQFEVVDAAIVGSYFKDTYKDTGEVDASHVQTLLARVNEVRSK